MLKDIYGADFEKFLDLNEKIAEKDDKTPMKVKQKLYVDRAKAYFDGQKMFPEIQYISELKSIRPSARSDTGAYTDTEEEEGKKKKRKKPGPKPKNKQPDENVSLLFV